LNGIFKDVARSENRIPCAGDAEGCIDLPMANVGDMNKDGGWLIQVDTPRGMRRLWYVYEIDKTKALDLAKSKIPVGKGETAEAKTPLNVHELTRFGMKLGEVKQCA
jgi:hypothetical protein